MMVDNNLAELHKWAELALLPVSIGEALNSGAKYYFTGVPCMRGHFAKRNICTRCVECAKYMSLLSPKELEAEDLRYRNSRGVEIYQAKQRENEARSERIKKVLKKQESERKARARRAKHMRAKLTAQGAARIWDAPQK